MNLAGPTPATAEQITRRLATDLHRPYLLQVPEAVDRRSGWATSAASCCSPSQQVVPREQLEQDGFVFRDRTSSDEAVDARASAGRTQRDRASWIARRSAARARRRSPLAS